MEELLVGFGALFSSPVLIAAIAGAVAAGIVFGALPGLTATMSMALFLPFTFFMPPEVGLSVLMGLFVGGIAGGSIPAILLNVPGTPASAATVLDGYQMTRKGRAAEALGISFIASAIGGLFSALVMSAAAPLIARAALSFQAPEFFVLAIYGLSIIAAVAGDSLVKGFIAGLIGLIVGLVGLDPITAQQRFTFGSYELYNGLSLIPVLIGVFGLTQVFVLINESFTGSKLPTLSGRKFPTWADLKLSATAILRGSLIGTAVGIVPGTGTDIGAFLSYSETKRWPKGKIPFGQGNPQGVAAADSANNAVVGGTMIPMFTLGIPGDAGSAVLLGGLLVAGLTPGPDLFVGEQAGTVYTLFASVILANIFVLAFGLLGIRLFVKVVRLPVAMIVPIIILLCLVGAYAINNRMMDVWVALAFGVLGYILVKFRFPVSPIILGLILGTLAESNYRRAMTFSHGDWTVFFTRPLSIAFWVLIIVSLVYVWHLSRKQKIAARAALDVLSGKAVHEAEEDKRTDDGAQTEGAEQAADARADAHKSDADERRR